MRIRSLLVIFLLVSVVLTGSIAGAQIDTGNVSHFSPESSTYGNESRYKVILKDAELKEALRFLAKVAGLNIIIPEAVSGVTNVHFDNVKVLDAINSIVKSNDLDYAIERGVLRIGKTGQFATTGEDLKTETIRLKFATAKDMVSNVKSLLTDRGSVLADQRTNSLVVRERLGNIDNVKRFLQDVDIKDAQVLIEAKIVEVTRDFSRNLGIQWGVNTTGNKVNVVGVNAVGQSDTKQNLNVNLPALNPTSGLGLLIGSLAGGTNIDVQITAAEKKGDARIISEPSIVTSNGVASKIRSGETMLIQTTGDLNIGTTTATANTGLQTIETGIELNVTPQISGSGLVKLKIATQTSQPDFTREVQGIPVIVDNTASTEVLVADGQTTVIGGLLKFTGSDTRKNVPFFSRIPLLGNAFKSSAKSKQNTELMIFIRPSIIRYEEKVLEYNSYSEQADALKNDTIVTPFKKPKEAPVEGPADTRNLPSSGPSIAVERNQYLRYKHDR